MPVTTKPATKPRATQKTSKPTVPTKKSGTTKPPATQPEVKARKPAAAPPPVAVPKAKLVRDSFTIPKPEYAVLEALKQRSAGLKRPVKKSELLRAGIKALQAMSDKTFLAALDGVPSLKTGRPKGEEADAPEKARK